MPDKLYSPKDVMEITGLSRTTVAHYGRKYGTKVGNTYVWTQEGLDECLSRIGKSGNPNWTRKDEPVS